MYLHSLSVLNCFGNADGQHSVSSKQGNAMKIPCFLKGTWCFMSKKKMLRSFLEQRCMFVCSENDLLVTALQYSSANSAETSGMCCFKRNCLSFSFCTLSVWHDHCTIKIILIIVFFLFYFYLAIRWVYVYASCFILGSKDKHQKAQ